MNALNKDDIYDLRKYNFKWRYYRRDVIAIEAIAN